MKATRRLQINMIMPIRRLHQEIIMPMRRLLQVAVHMRAVSISHLEAAFLTQTTRLTTALAFGTFQYTIGAVRHLLTNTMALTAGDAATQV